MQKTRQKKSTQDGKPHDLSVMVKLDRINPPKQARSEKRLQEIVQALESLLDGRSFEEITIPDIAEKAGCGTASIYARFKDKRSILVALHESIRDRQISQIDESSNALRHEKLTFNGSALAICRDIVSYYGRNKNLMRPSYLLGDREIYERHATVMTHASEKITALLMSKIQSKTGTKAHTEKRLDLATRSVFALLQQRMVFDSRIPGRFAPTDDEDVAKELALLYKLCLSNDKA